MLKEELRKIWRPGMIAALMVMGFIFYTMFLEFYIKYFPNGSQYEGMFDVARQMVEMYGTSVSEEEMAEFEAGIPALRREADQYVAESQAGKKYGFRTYEQYAEFWREIQEEMAGNAEAADQNEKYADAMLLQNYLQGDGTDNIEGRLYSSYLYVDLYRYDQEIGMGKLDEGYTQKEQEHAGRLFFGKDRLWQNILPPEVPQAAGNYMGFLYIWICLSVCFLLAPLTVHDCMSRMRPLQYSSRHGRRIYRSQFAAVMFSAFLLATVNMILFCGIFAMHGTKVFFPCRMYSFMAMPFCWPDWTHGTWCLVLVLMSYLIAMGTAGAVFFLSQRCTNYIGMMLKILPLFAAVAVLCPKVAENAFYYENDLYRFTGVPYIELICAAAVFTAGMLLCWLGNGKVKKEAG